jgi:hypothetical protein
MPAALDTAQLLLDIDQTINHRLDGLLVQLHLHAFDACRKHFMSNHAGQRALVTHLRRLQLQARGPAA